MDAQVQLCLDLTNLMKPVTSAVSALGSFSLAKAIKSAGSDGLTEHELASFLGRNRTDPSLELHFRQVVARSKRTDLSRYLDIYLDSGAGPTVQNALQTCELFSMVIQLSALCHVHKSDSLAQAITTAVERNIIDVRADLAKVPHYPSLCGTLGVCKQETASFQCSHVFDSVERNIESKLDVAGPSKRRRTNPRSHGKTKLSLNRPSIAIRTIDFPVLQTLFLCLHSLQQFPNERVLNVECKTGISTSIVWCYHVLGLKDWTHT